MDEVLNICLEEVALEGLDGITLNALWLRLNNREPPFNLKLDNFAKNAIWRVLATHDDVKFYELPAPRGLPVLPSDIRHFEPITGIIMVEDENTYNREPPFNLKLDNFAKNAIWRVLATHDDVKFYELPAPRGLPVLPSDIRHFEPITGIIMVEDEVENIYPPDSVSSEKHGIHGSCSTYFTRKDVTDSVREAGGDTKITLDEAIERYSDSLVLVASQDLRSKCLFGSELVCLKNMNDEHYRVLEWVGRSRHHGVFQADCVRKVNLQNKTVFYYRKMLEQMGLVSSQIVSRQQVVLREERSKGSCIRVNLISLKHKTIMQPHSRYDLIAEDVSKYLEATPHQMAPLNVVKAYIMEAHKLDAEMFRRNTALMKSMGYLDKHTLSHTLVTGYFKKKVNSTEDRSVGVLRLVKPFRIDTEEEEESEEFSMDPRYSALYIGKPVMDQVYDFIVGNFNKRGRASSFYDVSRALKLGHTYVRQLVRKLETIKLIRGELVNLGRQKMMAYSPILKSAETTTGDAVDGTGHQTPVKDQSEESCQTVAAEDILTTPQKKTSEGPLVTLKYDTPTTTPKGRSPSPVLFQDFVATRAKKRRDFMHALLEKNKVLIGYTHILKAIRSQERKEGIKTMVDKKTLIRIVKKMIENKEINEYPVQFPGKDKAMSVFTAAEVKENDPLLTSFIHQETFNRLGVAKKKESRALSKLKQAEKRAMLEEDSSASKQPIKKKKLSETHKEDDEEDDNEVEDNAAENKEEGMEKFPKSPFTRARHGYLPKIPRMRVLQMYLWYIVYDPAMQKNKPVRSNDKAQPGYVKVISETDMDTSPDVQTDDGSMRDQELEPQRIRNDIGDHVEATTVEGSDLFTRNQGSGENNGNKDDAKPVGRNVERNDQVLVVDQGLDTTKTKETDEEGMAGMGVDGDNRLGDQKPERVTENVAQIEGELDQTKVSEKNDGLEEIKTVGTSGSVGGTMEVNEPDQISKEKVGNADNDSGLQDQISKEKVRNADSDRSDGRTDRVNDCSELDQISKDVPNEGTDQNDDSLVEGSEVEKIRNEDGDPIGIITALNERSKEEAEMADENKDEKTFEEGSSGKQTECVDGDQQSKDTEGVRDAVLGNGEDQELGAEGIQNVEGDHTQSRNESAEGSGASVPSKSKSTTEMAQGQQKGKKSSKHIPRHLVPPKVYSDHDDWRRFVEPLPSYDAAPGWFMLGDVLSRMPLIVFVQTICTQSLDVNLSEYLNDPVKKNYPISQLPKRIRVKIQHKRVLISKLELNLHILSKLGHIWFTRELHRTKEQRWYFLANMARVVDTTSSKIGYMHTTEQDYPERVHNLASFEDLEKYWFDIKSVSLNTPLGICKGSQKRQGISEYKITKGLIQYWDSIYTKPDNKGHLPGDNRGACGFDSSTFAHIRRNWSWMTLVKPARKPPKIKFFKVSHKKVEKKQHNAPSRRPAVSIKKDGKVVQVPVKVKVVSSKEHKESNKGGKGLKRKRAKDTTGAKKPKLARKTKTAARPMVDEGDRLAQRRLKKKRCFWSPREDNFLLLCNLASAILNRKLTQKSFVDWRQIRDIMHSYLEVSKDKVSIGIAKRATYIFKYPQTKVNFSVCLMEIEEDEELMSNFMHRKADYTDPEVRLKEYKELLEVLIDKYKKQASQDMNWLSDLSLSDVKEKYDMKRALRMDDPRKLKMIRKKEVTCEADIKVAAVQSMIMGALHTHRDAGYDPCMMYDIFKGYEESLLQRAFVYLREVSVCARERYFREETSINLNRFLPHVPMSYQLSHTYFRFLNSVITNVVYSGVAQFHGLMKSSEDGHLRVPSNPTGGCCAGTLEAVAMGMADMDLVVPENIIIFDPNNLDDASPMMRKRKRATKADTEDGTGMNQEDVDDEAIDAELLKLLSETQEELRRFNSLEANNPQPGSGDGQPEGQRSLQESADGGCLDKTDDARQEKDVREVVYLGDGDISRGGPIWSGITERTPDGMRDVGEVDVRGLGDVIERNAQRPLSVMSTSGKFLLLRGLFRNERQMVGSYSFRDNLVINTGDLTLKIDQQAFQDYVGEEECRRSAYLLEFMEEGRGRFMPFERKIPISQCHTDLDNLLRAKEIADVKRTWEMFQAECQSSSKHMERIKDLEQTYQYIQSHGSMGVTIPEMKGHHSGWRKFIDTATVLIKEDMVLEVGSMQPRLVSTSNASTWLIHISHEEAGRTAPNKPLDDPADSPMIIEVIDQTSTEGGSPGRESEGKETLQVMEETPQSQQGADDTSNQTETKSCQKDADPLADVSSSQQENGSSLSQVKEDASSSLERAHKEAGTSDLKEPSALSSLEKVGAPSEMEPGASLESGASLGVNKTGTKILRVDGGGGSSGSIVQVDVEKEDQDLSKEESNGSDKADISHEEVIHRTSLNAGEQPQDSQEQRKADDGSTDSVVNSSGLTGDGKTTGMNVPGVGSERPGQKTRDVLFQQYYYADGKLNRKQYRLLINKVVNMVLESPGIKETEIQDSLEPVLHHVECLHVLQRATNFGCITRHRKEHHRLKGLFDTKGETYYFSYYMPTIDCMTRLAVLNENLTSKDDV